MDETLAFSSDIFRPADGDQSIRVLEQLFGGIIGFIHRGMELTDASGTVISDGMAILNLVMLMEITGLGLYTILSVTADTASDGVALGRSTDTKYTLLRMGIGAVLLFPIKGGFTVIQMLALYLVYMGVGLEASLGPPSRMEFCGRIATRQNERSIVKKPLICVVNLGVQSWLRLLETFVCCT